MMPKDSADGELDVAVIVVVEVAIELDVELELELELEVDVVCGRTVHIPATPPHPTVPEPTAYRRLAASSKKLLKYTLPF